MEACQGQKEEKACKIVRKTISNTQKLEGPFNDFIFNEWENEWIKMKSQGDKYLYHVSYFIYLYMLLIT